MTQNSPARYAVTISVPAPWRKETAPELITRLSRIIRSCDPQPERLAPDAVWVQVIGVSEGSLGVYDRPVTSLELAELMNRSFRESPDRDAIVAGAAPGTAIDPVCGGIVDLSDLEAITWRHEGTTYGFCCTDCRTSYAAEKGQRVGPRD